MQGIIAESAGTVRQGELMAEPIIDNLILERMVRAVEKVRERLARATSALEKAKVPYAVVGGNAIAVWVATVDEAAVRNTRMWIFCCVAPISIGRSMHCRRRDSRIDRWRGLIFSWTDQKGRSATLFTSSSPRRRHDLTITSRLPK